jgi:hypothetical protein
MKVKPKVKLRSDQITYVIIGNLLRHKLTEINILNRMTLIIGPQYVNPKATALTKSSR